MPFKDGKFLLDEGIFGVKITAPDGTIIASSDPRHPQGRTDALRKAASDVVYVSVDFHIAAAAACYPKLERALAGRSFGRAWESRRGCGWSSTTLDQMVKLWAALSNGGQGHPRFEVAEAWFAVVELAPSLQRDGLMRQGAEAFRAWPMLRGKYRRIRVERAWDAIELGRKHPPLSGNRLPADYFDNFSL